MIASVVRIKFQQRVATIQLIASVAWIKFQQLLARIVSMYMYAYTDISQKYVGFNC